MEFLEGRDLKAELRRRGPLPYGEAAAYMVHACRGIAVAHRLGIVHRDLKPHNLFLTGLDRVRTLKIVDFGVAKSLNASDPGLTATDAAVGTPLYMSPEQLIDARATSTKADVWALGVILYELLAGFSPFADSSPGAVIAAVTLDDPVPIQKVRPDVPDELARAIELALMKRPSDRIDTAEQLEQLLLGHATADQQLIVPSELDLQTQSAIARPPRTRTSAFLREQILAAIDADSPQERATLRCLPTGSTKGSQPLPERLSLVPALRSLTPELPALINKATASNPAPTLEVARRPSKRATAGALALLALVVAVPASILGYSQRAKRPTGSESVVAPLAASAQPKSAALHTDARDARDELAASQESTAANAESLELEPTTPGLKRIAVTDSEAPAKRARSTSRGAAIAVPATPTPVAPATTTAAKIVPRHL